MNNKLPVDTEELISVEQFLYLIQRVVQRHALIGGGGSPGSSFGKLQPGNIPCFYIDQLVVDPANKTGTVAAQEFFRDPADIYCIVGRWSELLILFRAFRNSSRSIGFIR